MINPSASGWIDKFFIRLKTKLPENTSTHDFYKTIRDTGFIYGYIPACKQLDEKETEGCTDEEITKVTLLYTLYELYRIVTKNDDKDAFIKQAILFYKNMTPEGYSFLKRVLPTAPGSRELEGILDQRVKTNDNIISRNFSHVLTNALLFIDVLAFRYYLTEGEINDDYLKKLEETTVSLASLALKTKLNKTAYDDLLIKLLESSVRYIKTGRININNIEELNLEYFTDELEHLYFTDTSSMAIWSDKKVEPAELEFLYKLGNKLQLDDTIITESIADFDVFVKTNRENIHYFKYSNPVKHFYNHASQNVMLLINRNKNRLIKELSNNGELMVLLTHSTHRSLQPAEKKKVKKQLLEICKTVPSLTIFLLPGGSLLLPLLIKFIPKLLPTVFNENLDNEE